MVKICNHNQELAEEKLNLLEHLKQIETKNNSAVAENRNLQAINKQLEKDLISNRNGFICTEPSYRAAARPFLESVRPRSGLL